MVRSNHFIKLKQTTYNSMGTYRERIELTSSSFKIFVISYGQHFIQGFQINPFWNLSTVNNELIHDAIPGRTGVGSFDSERSPLASKGVNNDLFIQKILITPFCLYKKVVTDPLRGSFGVKWTHSRSPMGRVVDKAVTNYRSMPFKCVHIAILTEFKRLFFYY